MGGLRDVTLRKWRWNDVTLIPATAARSSMRLAAFDPFRFMIAPRPLLLIVGTEAVTRWSTEDAFGNAKEPKELFWIGGATHVAHYDKPEYVTPASAKPGDFFRAHLNA